LRAALRFPRPELLGVGAPLGEAARARGSYTRAEFLAVCRWKTPRSASKVATNSAAAIRTATTKALASEDLAEQIGFLTDLDGIGIPTASTLLHFAFPEDFPILDVRALESLGVAARSTYSAAFWTRYVEACRTIAAHHSVSLRTLDKALWQHSKECPK
jgi:thermostable 8-oxoguanine DNA glycosylase